VAQLLHDDTIRRLVSEPKELFYGVEAVFKYPSGNWFSMSQPKNAE